METFCRQRNEWKYMIGRWKEQRFTNHLEKQSIRNWSISLSSLCNGKAISVYCITDPCLYRSGNLSDDVIELFRTASLHIELAFLAFTSCTCDRILVEFYGDNVLFIIDGPLKHIDSVSDDLFSYSIYSGEEEELLLTGVRLEIKSCVCDSANSQWEINLELYTWHYCFGLFSTVSQMKIYIFLLATKQVTQRRINCKNIIFCSYLFHCAWCFRCCRIWSMKSKDMKDPLMDFCTMPFCWVEWWRRNIQQKAN